MNGRVVNFKLLKNPKLLLFRIEIHIYCLGSGLLVRPKNPNSNKCLQLSNKRMKTLEIFRFLAINGSDPDNLDILMFPKFLCFSKAKNLPEEFINIKKLFTAVKYHVAVPARG